MRPSTALCFGLLVLALGSLAPQRADAWAEVCADNLLEANCYTNATVCHWNLTTSLCQNDTAATCVDNYRDTASCTAMSGCAVNSQFNDHCYTSLVACASIVSDPDMCTLRGDCELGADPLVNCTASTNTSKPYNFDTNPQGCVDAGYFYDFFAPQAAGGHGTCFYSAQAARDVYGSACSAYSDYPSPLNAIACVVHTGCSYDIGTGLCAPTPSGSSVTPDPLPLAVNRHYGDTTGSFNRGYIVALVFISAIVGIFILIGLWEFFRGSGSAAAASASSSSRGTGGKMKKSNSTPSTPSTSTKKAKASERELTGILTSKY